MHIHLMSQIEEYDILFKSESVFEYNQLISQKVNFVIISNILTIRILRCSLKIFIFRQQIFMNTLQKIKFLITRKREKQYFKEATVRKKMNAAQRFQKIFQLWNLLKMNLRMSKTQSTTGQEKKDSNQNCLIRLKF